MTPAILSNQARETRGRERYSYMIDFVERFFRGKIVLKSLRLKQLIVFHLIGLRLEALFLCLRVGFSLSDLVKTKVDVSELSVLQDGGVWCLKPDYIAEYLMQEPPPRPQRYQVPELTAHAESSKAVSSQSKKRKGDHDTTSCDKRPRV